VVRGRPKRQGRQALNAAIKALASGNYTPRPEPETGRICSECKAPIPDTAQATATTCSGTCRVARARRLKKEAQAGEVDLLGNPMTPIDADQFEQARKRGEAKAAARALGIERKRLGLLKA